MFELTTSQAKQILARESKLDSHKENENEVNPIMYKYETYTTTIPIRCESPPFFALNVPHAATGETILAITIRMGDIFLLSIILVFVVFMIAAFYVVTKETIS